MITRIPNWTSPCSLFKVGHPVADLINHYALNVQYNSVNIYSFIGATCFELWKRPMGRARRIWEDNIKMELQEVGGGCGDWMELVQDRDRWRALVSTVMNLRVPKKRGISWLAAEPVSFSRRTLLHGVSK